MDKYIGIDVHAASCAIAVIDAHGKQAQEVAGTSLLFPYRIALS